jgi:hypothetical protein
LDIYKIATKILDLAEELLVIEKWSKVWLHYWINDDGTFSKVTSGNHFLFVAEQNCPVQFGLDKQDCTRLKACFDNAKEIPMELIKKMLAHNYRVGLYGRDFYIESLDASEKDFRVLKSVLPEIIGDAQEIQWTTPYSSNEMLDFSVDAFFDASSLYALKRQSL